MNLYLYIPPKSSHPPGVLRGLILGRCRKYWFDNQNKDDYRHFALLLAERLAKRGHSRNTLGPLFAEATARLEETTSPETPQESNPEKDKIFFHLPFHTRGIQRQAIRRAFANTIGPRIPARRLTVAVSRTPNPRDRL